MKETMLAMGVCLTLVGITGCAKSMSEGAAGTEQNAALTGSGESQPAPMASPTFRPGMNSRDPRDPLFNARNPQPLEYPPQVAK